ncbi:MAG: DUF2177 family protein [Aliiglaciecola sp.]
MKKVNLYIVAMASVMIAYLILDGIWLGLVAKDTYIQSMQGMLRDEYPVAPWVTFYIMYSFVITHLVVMSNLNKGLGASIRDGALLGLASYGAYNLTNYAILAGWPLPITLIDWIWGTCLTATTAGVGALVVKKFVSNDRSV